MENRELVQALLRKDPAAWEKLVKEYMNVVYGTVRRTVSMYGAKWADSDVDDLSLSVFENLVKDDFRALSRLREPYDIKSWLIVSARRKTIDHLRAKRMPLAPIVEEAAVSKPPTEHLPAKEIVEEALKQLNDREAMIVRLVFFHDKKYKDVAQIMGINMNSIGPTLMRALDKVREVMKKKV
jgi:RNA polymerase sigma-70 factor (ECF subfamily)